MVQCHPFDCYFLLLPAAEKTRGMLLVDLQNVQPALGSTQERLERLAEQLTLEERVGDAVRRALQMQEDKCQVFGNRVHYAR